MTVLAQLVGVFVVMAGLVGVVAPGGLLAFGRSIATVPGLYGLAALRVCIGIVLAGASRASRAPRTLRILGALVIVGGLVTPWFGVERTRGALEWGAGLNPMVIRLVAAVLAGAGVWLIYLMPASRRR